MFTITDSNLFNYTGNKAYKARVSTSQQPANLLSIVTYCTETEIGIFTGCPYPDTEECINGCDHCEGCLTYFTTMDCWTGPGTEEMPSGGGGTTNNTNNSTPPTCTGSISACGPGWLPIDDVEAPHGPVPCDAYIQQLKTSTAFNYYFDFLKSNNVVSSTFEIGFLINSLNDGSTNSYQYKAAAPSKKFIEWTVTQPLAGIIHSHYAGNPPSTKMFTADDVLFMCQLFKGLNNTNGSWAAIPEHFFFGVTSLDNEPYIILVEDVAKFTAFCNKVIELENKGEQFFTKKIEYQFKSNSPGINERDFLRMLTALGDGGNAGIGIYKGKLENHNWERLYTNPNFANEAPLSKACY